MRSLSFTPVWVGRYAPLFLLLAAFHLTALAGGAVKPQAETPRSAVPGYLVRIDQNKPEEVEAALLRAEAFYLESEPLLASAPPIALVLHGPEVEIFFRENYKRYKNIVDLAARLTAFQVVDIKICRTRLRFLEQNEASLFPFVGTVAFGPDEIARLTEEEGYLRF
ncbi:MAG: acyl-CoA transferase [Gammaproteobacteria bacterium]|nr:acyl-CoA transferase [Gammaproteobacteria bacterium]MBQ0840954.1 acyl-CoA transferase [Gammaproteobacteria bacterium]